ncbi:MAG TPA: hypothetical protein PL169_08650 [Leptospiraceae bacterium]|nr:hypothetical protein [Leptospiraceae bacterium]
MKEEYYLAALFGFICLIFGTLIGITVAYTSQGSGYELFPLYSGLSSFLTASFVYWFFCTRTGDFGEWKGAGAGALSGLIAHYFSWYLMLIGQNVCFHFFGGCRSSLNEPPMNVLYGLFGVFPLTFFSLIFLGWVTVPGGAVLGWIFNLIAGRRISP